MNVAAAALASLLLTLPASVQTRRLLIGRSVEGRRIEFDVEATDGVAPIGAGTHERMVIDMLRFVERLKREKQRP